MYQTRHDYRYEKKRKHYKKIEGRVFAVVSSLKAYGEPLYLRICHKISQSYSYYLAFKRGDFLRHKDKDQL